MTEGLTKPFPVVPRLKPRVNVMIRIEHCKDKERDVLSFSIEYSNISFLSCSQSILRFMISFYSRSTDSKDYQYSGLPSI